MALAHLDWGIMDSAEVVINIVLLGNIRNYGQLLELERVPDNADSHFALAQAEQSPDGGILMMGPVYQLKFLGQPLPDSVLSAVFTNNGGWAVNGKELYWDFIELTSGWPVEDLPIKLCRVVNPRPVLADWIKQKFVCLKEEDADVAQAAANYVKARREPVRAAVSPYNYDSDDDEDTISYSYVSDIEIDIVH